MKKLLLIGFIALGINSFAQTGINQTEPKATLDIQAKNTDGSTKEGLLIPRLSKSALAHMGTEVEESTTIYVNNIDNVPSGTQTATVANIFEVGFYSYIDGSWQKHNTKDNNTNLNKEYVCTEGNIGQILNTAKGYFICRNEALSETDFDVYTTVTDAPRWAYIGMMDGNALVSDEDGNYIKEVPFSLLYDGVYSYVPYYDNLYFLNGKNHSVNSLYDEPNNVGFSSIIPSTGYLVFFYHPFYGCGILSNPNVYNIRYYIKKLVGNNQQCPIGTDKLRIEFRFIDYRILDQ